MSIQQGERTMSTIKALVQDGTERFNARTLTAADDLFTPDLVMHSVRRGDIFGLEAVRAFWESTYIAYPDVQVTAKDLIADGDLCVAHYTFSGTNKGPIDETPATNKSVNFEMVQMHRVENGKVAEIWQFYNPLIPLQQLGLMPAIA
jgi:steroid delta-isomerase-like uncharacterized protein